MNQKHLLISKITLLSSCILITPMTLANHPISPDRQWLLGDLNGERQKLENKGYKFTLSALTESANNLHGGYNNDHKFSTVSQITLGTAFDFEKIAGWKDTTASLVITKRDGDALTFERINDPRVASLGNVQEVYGRGKIWRLTQAWVKKGFDDHRLQLKFGRMGMSEDFNTSQCEFQNLLLCGSQLGKSIGSIWFNSPVGVWGLNAKYQISPEWMVGLGVYEINPDNVKTLSNSDGFNLGMKNVKGATIPLEFTWKPQLAVFNGLSGEYKLGGLYSTAKANDLQNTEKTHHGKHSFWLNAQQQLTQNQDDDKRGLYVSFNAVENDRATTLVKNTQQLVFWYKGPFDHRPADSIAFGLARYHVNERAREQQIASNIQHGYTSYDPVALDYKPVQNDEVNVELNYTYQWSPAIMLRPNVQYVYQPAGVKEVKDAWVAGLTMRLNF